MRFRFVLSLLPIVLSAQQFEVASVKPSTSGFNGVRGGCHGIDSRPSSEVATVAPLGRCVITDARLSHLIMTAWSLPAIATIKGAPDWVIAGAERFNVNAEAENSTKATEQQLLVMLQHLLIERFQLKFHRENQDEPGFALVMGKNGPDLKASTSENPTTIFPGGAKPAPGGPISLGFQGYSMSALAALLSQIGSVGPVVDKTGLSGFYDFKLSWDQAAGPTLDTALQEQLGLRLFKQQVPVSYFVFESAQRPAAN